MGMSIPYEQLGRRRQKARTHAALIQAARQLLGEGTTPTVEEAGGRAEIARTTAYRYFPNQKADRHRRSLPRRSCRDDALVGGRLAADRPSDDNGEIQLTPPPLQRGPAPA